MNKRKKAQEGTTLIEVLLATVILVLVVGSIVVLVPKVIRAVIQRSERAAAYTLASSSLQSITASPLSNHPDPHPPQRLKEAPF